jgi:hypothetical protein
MGMAVKQIPVKEKKGMNPLWRGIGCILIVIAPIVTYALTAIISPLLAATGYVPLELLGFVEFPEWVSKVPILNNIAGFIGGIHNLYLGITVFITIFVLLTGIFSMIFVALFQAIGPPRYSEIDAPPSRHKAKKYTR